MASKRKCGRKNVQRVLRNKEHYAQRIHWMLAHDAYRPSPYTVRTVKDGASGKERLIQIPKFYPDQIIHWALMIQIKPIMMRGMYAHTCGSVPGRGQSHGQKYLRRWLDRDHKGTKYCLKMDISKFYQNVDHDLLKARFRRVIKDRRALGLIDIIIDSASPGLPIGNYTSQWFSNFFLQDLDNFIKQHLKIKYYVRYVDDLVLLGSNKKELHRARKAIELYLSSLNLTLKGDWQVYPVASRPIDFLGYKFYRSHTTLRKRNALRIRRRVKSVSRKRTIPYRDAAAVISYLGIIVRCNSNFYRTKYIDSVISIRKLKGVISDESRSKRSA